MRLSVTPEELQALQDMPVYFLANGLLPEDAPSLRVIEGLYGKGLIVPLPHDNPNRYALTYRGQRLLWPEPFQRFQRRGDREHAS